MKKLITMVIMVLAVAVAKAQAPEKFTYQAVVRNASNALVTNTLVGVRVSILQGSATGSGVYVETQMTSTNANGLITLNIGDGNAVFGTFGSIDWSAGPYFLKTEIDPAGGNNYSVTSTQQLLSVPYALYAKEAGNSFSGDYNDLTNTPAIPTVPTNVSAFANDAGYITGYTETDPTVPAWAKEANKPTYNYSEIVNTPTIPTVPTNVSAFTNDAGYITSQDIPAIPTVPTNVSAFTNDAGYITGYTETDPTVPVWAKEANKPAYDYTEIANTPAIPTVPTNVSAFTNDAGYLTDYTETDPTISAWAKEANKPTYDYTEITNTPVIPTVPTNVSAFTNDAGYLTSYTETDPQFNAWDKSYNDLINTPTNVSAFANDAQYITAEAIPTQVSAFNNDAEYITIAAVPTQVSAFENDALYITEGELQQTVNVINNTFDSVDNTIDSLRNRIDELEGHHTPPTVMTTGVADVAYLSATVNGSVVYIGGAPVAAKGFCYDTVMHPTVESNMVNCGSGSGSFSTNLLNLKSSTTYFVRAYATNMWGTNYGDELSFTTLVEHAPSVEILPASEISYTSFVCSGDVTDSGTYSVTARGFCWSTDPDPVMTGEHLHVGNGSGTFSALLANMQPETTFYVRAYAVNAAGVTYSTPITVSTLSPTIPTVSTDTVNGYNECTGTVLADGNAPVTQRGFCYDTLPSPTLENGVVIADGSGLGEFTATLTGLPVGKLYFVRAFATNAKGTAYGNQIHFHASSCDTKTLTDYDGNVYNTVAIGTQCWMKENLKTTHYSDGWPIEWSTDATFDIPHYYYPANTPSNSNNYGLLYNWKAVMRNNTSSNSTPSGVQGICPTGWHVPSDQEWSSLIAYSSQPRYCCSAGIILADSIGWFSTDYSSGTNATGFSANPAGYAYSEYSIYGFSSNIQYDYGYFTSNAYYWTSTGCDNENNAFNYRFLYQDPTVYRSNERKTNGLSVRCLRDY